MIGVEVSERYFLDCCETNGRRLGAERSGVDRLSSRFVVAVSRVDILQAGKIKEYGNDAECGTTKTKRGQSQEINKHSLRLEERFIE